MSNKLPTSYLGMNLSSPVVVGACPLTLEPEKVQQMVAAGAGAIVLPSMLQEQITYDLLKPTEPIDAVSKSRYQPQHDRYNGGTENYLQTIRNLKTLCQVPIIGSLNGSSTGPWLEYANKTQDAGIDALKLNWQRRLLIRMSRAKPSRLS